MSAVPRCRYKNKDSAPGQLGAAIVKLGVDEKDAMGVETALRAAAKGSPILSYDLEELADGCTKFTVIIGPRV